MNYPASLTKLIDCFQMMPGIGQKTAERLAFYMITQMKKDDIDNFSKSMIEAANKIKRCSICGMISESDVCDICSDSTKDNEILVVESPKDVINFEKNKLHYGKYHVLNGLISPLNGVGPDDINLSSLISRIDLEKTKEVIIATSATIEGEITAKYIANILKKKDVEVTRIGYGLPAGADIEYADEITLAKALESRKKI